MFILQRGPYTSKYRCTDESYLTKVLEFKVGVQKKMKLIPVTYSKLVESLG